LTLGAPLRERVYQNTGNLPLLDLLPPGAGRVLDCGCGAGDNARILAARGFRVTGITLSEGEGAAAQAHCERVLVADLESGLPPSVGDGFDAVLMSHVLEHLVDPTAVLRDAARVLTAGGLLAVALPNALFYANRARLLLGRFDYTEGGLMDETHVRFYTFQTAAALLRRSGWELTHASGKGTFPLWHVRKLLPPGVAGALDLAACRWRPGLFGFQLLYLARPIGQAQERDAAPCARASSVRQA
jgi:2-polyprenyl-3-methyl-5-hydroxy-6-metoxy-1,4-benzoquinol methylase